MSLSSLKLNARFKVKIIIDSIQHDYLGVKGFHDEAYTASNINVDSMVVIVKHDFEKNNNNTTIIVMSLNYL